MQQSVFFDLDGTLADTAPDFAYALNAVLERQSRPPLPFAAVRRTVSLGSYALIKLAFDLEPDQAPCEDLRNHLLQIYRANLCRETRLFPGMPELLDTLEQRSTCWGIVTNKPAWLTDPLLEALGLSSRSTCIVSGDTTEHAKPHPEPLLQAAQLAGSKPSDCIYVGDHRRDVEAGRRAGMRTLVALFGYVEPGDQPHRWGADGLINTPQEILDWL